MKSCKAIGCTATIPTLDSSDFCAACSNEVFEVSDGGTEQKKYSKYFKDFSGDDEADVYLVHHRFEVQDHSGCIHHASKKLLLSGVRTGGKSKYQDIMEARDTLNRWLEINSDTQIGV